MHATACLWAKLGASYPEHYHPVACHLVDVAQVCLRLWGSSLCGPVKQRLADGLGLDPAAAGRWLALWAGARQNGV